MEKNFPFLTTQDVSRLFRETYTLAMGNITYKTIHFICSSKGLFIPLIREKLMRKCRSQPKENKDYNDLLYIDLQNCVGSLNSGV